jgi:hypothetical protein
MLRAERLVRNQARCRAANEEVRRAAAAFSDPAREPDVRFDFLCECARRTCRAMVELSLGEYEAVRADPATFVVAPGHQIESIESVDRLEPRYCVVRKVHPEPLKKARELDPRRGRPPQA